MNVAKATIQAVTRPIAALADVIDRGHCENVRRQAFGRLRSFREIADQRQVDLNPRLRQALEEKGAAVVAGRRRV